jgi:hypothetical protein
MDGFYGRVSDGVISDSFLRTKYILKRRKKYMSTSSTNFVPNIILIHVDELRFPTEFPEGVGTAEAFLARFMPYTHRLLWQDGVKFTNSSKAVPLLARWQGKWNSLLSVSSIIRLFMAETASDLTGREHGSAA